MKGHKHKGKHPCSKCSCFVTLLDACWRLEEIYGNRDYCPISDAEYKAKKNHKWETEIIMKGDFPSRELVCVHCGVPRFQAKHSFTGKIVPCPRRKIILWEEYEIKP